MSARQYRKVVAIALTATVGLSLAACSSSKSNNAGTPGKTTIVVDCAPLKTQFGGKALAAQNADIAAFEKIHPNIIVKSISVGSQCDNPPDFTARLNGGSEADAYYAYMTDLNQALDLGQAADISKYLTSTNVPNWGDVQPDWKAPFASNGVQYGIPTSNYTMGLVVNKKLFAAAGLDPHSPPTTWEDVATDAKKIAATGAGVYGYADYSANHTGGWHFAAELYSAGGELVTADDKTADFNNAMGTQVLQSLYNMRWNDNSVGTKQLLQWPDLLTLAGAGKVGMFIGAPDAVGAIVSTFKGNYKDWAMGAMPGFGGPAKAALSGGNGFLFRKGDSPAQISAAVQWISYEYLTPGQGQFNFSVMKDEGNEVGEPEPNLFVGGSASDKAFNSDAAKFADVDPADYAAYVNNPIAPKAEAPNTQPIYAILDSAMSAVLTQKSANIPALLKTATTQVNAFLKQPAAGS